MFQFNEKARGLDLPGSRIIRAYRSLNNAQVALPGMPAQIATAYLCAFQGRNGILTVAALHLHTSRRVFFYFHDGGEALEDGAERAWEEGVRFAESMGFMMGDLDFHLHSPNERDALWDALPFRNGDPATCEKRTGRDNPPSASPETAPSPLPEKKREVDETGMSSATPVLSRFPVDREKTRRSARPPRSTAEMAERRKTFVENMGRFLASL